jgi:hypothetical protein
MIKKRADPVTGPDKILTEMRFAGLKINFYIVLKLHDIIMAVGGEGNRKYF